METPKKKWNIGKTLGVLAAIGGGAAVMKDAPSPKMEFAHERVSNTESPAQALWSLYDEDNEKEPAPEALQRIRTAVFSQVLTDHPGLAERIQQAYGNGEIEIGHPSAIYVFGQKEEGPQMYNGRTYFGVYIKHSADGHAMNLFDIGVRAKDGVGQIDVKHVIDGLSEFFPGEPTQSWSAASGEGVNTTAKVSAISEIVTLPDGAREITMTLQYPDGKIGTLKETFAPNYQGDPQDALDYHVGDTIPWVQYKEEDGVRIVINRTSPAG